MRDIDLVKLPSEAVGSQREESRAAAHLLLFACCSNSAEPARNDAPLQAQVQFSFASQPFFYLTSTYQVQLKLAVDGGQG
jgi:outer membrane biogenesis lipoprotein LolB